MKQFVFSLVIVCGVCAGLAQDAQAQTGTWADRGYLNIGFGVESGSSSLTDTQNITIYEEAGTITSRQVSNRSPIRPPVQRGTFGISNCHSKTG